MRPNVAFHIRRLEHRLIDGLGSLLLIGITWIALSAGNHLASAAIVTAAAGGNTPSVFTDHATGSTGGSHDINLFSARSTSTSGIASRSAILALAGSTTATRMTTSSSTHFPNSTIEYLSSRAAGASSSSSHLFSPTTAVLVGTTELPHSPTVLSQVQNATEFTRTDGTTLPAGMTGLVRIRIWFSTFKGISDHTILLDNSTDDHTAWFGSTSNTTAVASSHPVTTTAPTDSSPAASHMYRTTEDGSSKVAKTTMRERILFASIGFTDAASIATSNSVTATPNGTSLLLAKIASFVHQSKQNLIRARPFDAIAAVGNFNAATSNTTSASTVNVASSTNAASPAEATNSGTTTGTKSGITTTTNPAITTSTNSGTKTGMDSGVTTVTTSRVTTASTRETTSFSTASEPGEELTTRTRKFRPYVNKEIYKSPDWFFPYPGRWPPRQRSMLSRHFNYETTAISSSVAVVSKASVGSSTVDSGAHTSASSVNASGSTTGARSAASSNIAAASHSSTRSAGSGTTATGSSTTVTGTARSTNPSNGSSSSISTESGSKGAGSSSDRSASTGIARTTAATRTNMTTKIVSHFIFEI